uniref:Uncharacterized protein n=1 Tax=Rhizophora mucronata TaxID=61149 RepID=A0A2P2IRI1_RHIMU
MYVSFIEAEKMDLSLWQGKLGLTEKQTNNSQSRRLIQQAKERF